MSERIIRRDEWGARYGDGRYWTDLPAKEVWLHHSVTIAPDLWPPYGDDDEAIRTIEDIGKDRFGEVYGFPYTWGITPVGRIYEGHNVSKTGAHTHGHNTDGRAIVLVGNYEEDEPTDAQVDSIVWLLNKAADMGWIETPQLTGGHRDVKATSCPGQHAYNLIPTINMKATHYTEVTMNPDLVIYAPRNIDYLTACAVAGARGGRAVPVLDAGLAQEAVDNGLRVVAVGGPAADDLHGEIEAVGADAIASLIKGAEAA